MHDEYEQHRREYWSRMRRIRRLLRPLPRRATIARYPVLKWFAATARKSWFLWSFKRGPLLRAIYFGSVLSLLPLFGVQLPVSIALCLLLRANLPVCAALQFVTNPFTLVPVYGFTYWVGDKLLDLFRDAPAAPGVDQTAVALSAVEQGTVMSAAGDVGIALVVGGVVVGLAMGVLVDVAWRLFAWEARVFRDRYRRARERAAARRPH